MNYESDKHQKAVMASQRNKGLIYPELNGSYSSRSDDIYDWELDPQYFQKLIKLDLQKAIREKELNAERKQRPVVEEEIKQILALAVKVLEEDKEKMLLSSRFNDVIKMAVQTGIDKNIIVKLREIQQQLVKNIPNTLITVKLQETQQQLVKCIPQKRVKNQETQQQLVKGIPQKLEKNIPKHVKCICCEKLIKPRSKYSDYYIYHEIYFICEKCGQKITQS